MLIKKLPHISMIGSLIGLFCIMRGLFFSVLPAVGIIGIVFYLASLTCLMSYVLHRVGYFQLKKWSTAILAFGVVFISVSIFLGLPIIFWKLTTYSISSMLLLYTLLLYIFALYTKRKQQPPQSTKKIRAYNWPVRDSIAQHYIWFVVYGAVWLLGILSLFFVAETETILSPWQALPSTYLIAVAITGFITLLLLFSRTKTSYVLCIIVLQSILMHAYIPASHILPAGGDIWRHIGTVQSISNGNEIGPGLYPPVDMTAISENITIPAIFTKPQQYAYASMWGTMSTWQQIAGDTTLLQFSRWVLPSIWAVTIPIIFFYIGYILFSSSRHGLIISALSLIPFALQAIGSFYLPVTIGYIAFFVALLFLLLALRYGTKLQWILVYISAVGLVFVYPVHAIIFMFLVPMAWVLHRIELHENYSVAENNKKTLQIGTAILFSVLCIWILPFVELAAGYSAITFAPGSILDTLKQIIGEHSAWYIFDHIRPHDIASGNILFNHVPDYAYVKNIFTSIRWPLLVFATLVYGFALFAWVYIHVKESDIRWKVIALLASIVWGGYMISWYGLVGDHQLVRRLDGLFAFCLLILAWYGIIKIISLTRYHKKKIVWSTYAILSIGILAWWSAMSAFTLGPDIRYVSANEYAVAGQIENTYQTDDLCVVADTWVLLALEAETNGELKGGGFAFDAQYAQPLRTALYKESVTAPSSTLWSRLAKTEQVSTCILAIPIDDNQTSVAEYKQAYGTPILSHSFYIWEKQLQKTATSTTIESTNYSL